METHPHFEIVAEKIDRARGKACCKKSTCDFFCEARKASDTGTLRILIIPRLEFSVLF